MTTEKRKINVRRILTMILCFIVGTLLGASIFSVVVIAPTPDEETVSVISTEEVETEARIIEEEPTTVVYNPPLTDEEIDLIALVTMAEAEGEPEEGKRLVIDTILNRVEHESPEFPDTVYDVVYKPHQFDAMWNGRVDRCEVREDICQLVREELVSRTNSEVIFFRRDYYSKYGTPLFQVGNHCFSKY